MLNGLISNYDQRKNPKALFFNDIFKIFEMQMNFHQNPAFIPINTQAYQQQQQQPGGFVYINPNPQIHKEKSNHEDLKARNRIAAKKWRDKKDEALATLESANDELRKEALQLRNVVLSLKTETQVLENELRYFQSFMSRIMNKTPNKPNLPLPPIDSNSKSTPPLSNPQNPTVSLPPPLIRF
ncbi:hypothetical protein TRFO_32078 [Tritrichomonas foetus]|uniref:BZIP domain-containing protein n=1 Tax=Tritrichomonas foetus TaxID=1144522 RepID=A0A1J4JUJ5_9EUKA|nr:hypothetical protein TRFO_32078 [Tritrichomonas foetus]|eukprot:OHT01190.1 hypothetical protein TRFO_32078 [Tritrichomonas foetus]